MNSPETKEKIAGSRAHRAAGFTLLELVITLTVLTIMTLGVIPLIKTSVKRQREQQLRESLRTMREAIKEFHRDASVPCAGAPGVAGGLTSGNATAPPQSTPPGANPNQPQFIDPRSRVCISDPTIFGVDNPDHYPPTLEILKDGVDVLPRQPAASALIGTTQGNATENNKLQTTPKKKSYLRAIPVDPMTGGSEWELRSVYDSTDAASWGGENVFDVRSKSNATSLNGEKYSDW
ncbi:MAG: type II secretion system protein [Pyrinomonadaceae bacterium]